MAREDVSKNAQVYLDHSAQLKELGQQLVELVTSQEFMQHVQAVFEAEESVRLSEAANRLTPTALRKAGLPVPEWTRISSRYFEEGKASEISFIDIEGDRDILQKLHEIEPGILDDIGLNNKELLFKLTNNKKLMAPEGAFAAAGACVCVGGGPRWSVCVGGGL